MKCSQQGIQLSTAKFYHDVVLNLLFQKKQTVICALTAPIVIDKALGMHKVVHSPW